MSPLAADWIVVAAPVLGAVVNVFCLIGLVRLRRGSLIQLIVTAFVAGAVVTAVGMALACSYEASPPLDGVGLALSALAAYSSAGFVFFALVNLGETSLRIRMIGHLLENPEGLCPAEILQYHPETALIEVRIRRMKEARHILAVDGRLYPRLSGLSLVAMGISLLRWLLYGRRNGPASEMASEH